VRATRELEKRLSMQHRLVRDDVIFEQGEGSYEGTGSEQGAQAAVDIGREHVFAKLRCPADGSGRRRAEGAFARVRTGRFAGQGCATRPQRILQAAPSRAVGRRAVAFS